MPSYLEYEMKNSAMIRKMSGEVRDAYKSQIYELFDADENATGENITYKEACARWHWIIVVYTTNMEEMSEYLDIIELSFDNKINLDEDLKWKRMMRLVLSPQFKTTMHSFTQVPRLAILNQTPLRKGKEIKTRALFRK